MSERDESFFGRSQVEGSWIVVRHCWLTTLAAVFIGTAAAPPCRAAQTPDEVRAVLRAWDWSGDWFTDCEHKDKGGHYVARLEDTSFPSATMIYEGKFTSKGRITAARVESDGDLIVVTDSVFQPYLATQTTSRGSNRDNSLRISSADGVFEAITDVPPHMFDFAPEGMVRGTHFHSSGVKDSMVLDRFEKPVRPTLTYHRCEQPVS